jgi:group I intron endonuclease
MKAGIYKVSVGPWFYWGQTNNFKRREKQHLTELKDGRHKNIILRNAYAKYQAFEFEIISIVEDPDERTEWEQDILDVWCGTENCANLNPQAMVPPSRKGKTLSDEHRAVLTTCNTGKKRSAETLSRMSASQKGKRKSDAHRAALSASQKGRVGPNKGRTFSEEHRAKIAAAKKAYYEKRRQEKTQ